MVEQRPFKALVVGSSPTQPMKRSKERKTSSALRARDDSTRPAFPLCRLAEELPHERVPLDREQSQNPERMKERAA